MYGAFEKPLNAQTDPSVRRALLLYAGTFGSMDGETEITAVHIEKILAQHNTTIKQLGENATMADFPPLMVDHSISARDVVGRLVGEVERGEHEGKPALYGTLQFLGAENIERVIDGRWTHVSISADLETGKIIELTVTPFPAVPNAKMFSQGQGQGKGEAMKLKLSAACMAALVAKFAEESKQTPEEAEANVKEMDEPTIREAAKRFGVEIEIEPDTEDKPPEGEGDDPTRMSSRSVKSKGHLAFIKNESGDWELYERSGRVMKAPVGQPLALDTEQRQGRDEGSMSQKDVILKKISGTNLSADNDADENKIKMSAGFQAIKKKTADTRFALNKALITTRIARLRGEAKITPAEVKSIDVEKLARASAETQEAVIASYKNRQPVIHLGLYGSATAADPTKVANEARRARMAKMEADARARMSSVPGGGENTAKDTVPADVPTPVQTPEEKTVGMAEDEAGYQELRRMILAGEDDKAKEIWKASRRMSVAEPSVDEETVANLMGMVVALEGDFDSIVRLAQG
jgi:hypothetical protein